MIQAVGGINFNSDRATFRSIKVKKQSQPEPISTKERAQSGLDFNPSEDQKTDGEKKLEVLAEKVSQPLIKLTTLPVLKLFPITITVDLRKVTIDDMTFWKSHAVRTITYESLKDVSLETGIIAATLRFTLSGQSQRPIVVPQLPKPDAIKAKQIVVGLIHCHKEHIKPEELDPEKDLANIMAIGKANKR